MVSKRFENEYLRESGTYWTEEEMAEKMNKIHNMDCLRIYEADT